MQFNNPYEPLAVALDSVLSELARDEYGSVPAPVWCELFTDVGRVLLPANIKRSSLVGLAGNDWLRLHGSSTAASTDSFRSDLETLVGESHIMKRDGKGGTESGCGW